MENKQIKCPQCKGINLIKRGYRKTQNRGKIQRFSCRDCSFRFVQDDGFFRMRNAPQKITLCLDLFFKGVSTRKVQEHLQAFYPHNSSHVSIYKWVIKYSKMISRYTNRLKPKISNSLMVDEMQFKTKGKESWFIDALDPETRFIVSSNYVEKRELKEIKDVLRKCKKKNKRIDNITTDGLRAYEKTVKKTFYLYGKKVVHNRVNASKGEGFNHRIERLHNSVRDRTKIFRGFHGSISSANSIMKGYEVYYNFVRNHQAIDKTPSELAFPNMQLGVNRWLGLIILSKNSINYLPHYIPNP